MNTLEAFTTHWRSISLDDPPYALQEDLTVLGSLRGRRKTVILRSFREFATGDGIARQFDDSRFHLGLIPQPYIGSLESATIFLLMLNPSLRASDYFAENSVPEYREALVKNLRQESVSHPFIFLAPDFAWSPGADYWRRKFHWLAKKLALQRHQSYHEALGELSSCICCIQLVPYHSASFDPSSLVWHHLASSQGAVSFVQNHLVPRARLGEILVVALRRAEEWGFQESQPGVIIYKGGERVGAHLTAKTRGGKAILHHLGIGAN